jgi:hypothetical protein
MKITYLSTYVEDRVGLIVDIHSVLDGEAFEICDTPEACTRSSFCNGGKHYRNGMRIEYYDNEPYECNSTGFFSARLNLTVKVRIIADSSYITSLQ